MMYILKRTFIEKVLSIQSIHAWCTARQNNVFKIKFSYITLFGKPLYMPMF